MSADTCHVYQLLVSSQFFIPQIVFNVDTNANIQILQSSGGFS